MNHTQSPGNPFLLLGVQSGGTPSNQTSAALAAPERCHQEIQAALHSAGLSHADRIAAACTALDNFLKTPEGQKEGPADFFKDIIRDSANSWGLKSPFPEQFEQVPPPMRMSNLMKQSHPDSTDHQWRPGSAPQPLQLTHPPQWEMDLPEFMVQQFYPPGFPEKNFPLVQRGHNPAAHTVFDAGDHRPPAALGEGPPSKGNKTTFSQWNDSHVQISTLKRARTSKPESHPDGDLAILNQGLDFNLPLHEFGKPFHAYQLALARHIGTCLLKPSPQAIGNARSMVKELKEGLQKHRIAFPLLRVLREAIDALDGAT